MGKQMNPYPLRVSEPTFSKLKIVAKENDRSLNGQIENILKAFIANYEKENGTIEIPAQPKEDE